MSSLTGSQGMRNQTGGRAKMPKAPSGYKRFQQYTPEQMDLMDRYMGLAGPDSFLSKIAGGDQSAFAETEAPALRQFSELQGGMASRFSGEGGRGSLGSRRSSGFQNTSNAAASNFAQDLQSRRMAMQRQAIMDLKGISSDLLEKRPYGMVEKQEKQGGGWMGLAGAGVGALGGFLLGGPAGGFAGASLGYNVGSGFDKGGRGGGGGGGGGNYSSLGQFKSPFDSSPQYPLTAGYDQEFRMNPSAMGY